MDNGHTKDQRKDDRDDRKCCANSADDADDRQAFAALSDFVDPTEPDDTEYQSRDQYKKRQNKADHVWVSDTTCFKLNNLYYYICVIIDLYSRRVVAHSISPKHSTQLITRAFKSAFKIRQPGDGLIFHSDRGSQYTSYAFGKLLKACKAEHSFSPTGKPCHNAVMESFFSSMKKEKLYRTNYHSVNELMKHVGKYIEFYNMERPHAGLDYKTPNTYERLFYEHNFQKAN